MTDPPTNPEAPTAIAAANTAVGPPPDDLKPRTLTRLSNVRPTWLDLAHRKLDAAVAAAYGWPADLPDEAILERLLELNRAQQAAQKTKRQEAQQV